MSSLTRCPPGATVASFGIAILVYSREGRVYDVTYRDLTILDYDLRYRRHHQHDGGAGPAGGCG
jgi:hypothetical protein